MSKEDKKTDAEPKGTDTKNEGDDKTSKNDEGTASPSTESGTDKNPVKELAHDDLMKNPHYAGLHKEISEIRKESKVKKEKAEKEALEAKEKKGEFEEIVKDLKPKAEKAAEYEEVINEIVDKEIQNIPEDIRSLIPDELSPAAKLRYIANNRSRLMPETGVKPVGKVSNPPTDGTGVDNSGKETFTKSQIADPMFYLANEQRIIAAQKEGRIIDG